TKSKFNLLEKNDQREPLKASLQNHVYSYCTFDSCDFSEALLHEAKFCFCTFVNCNLSLLKLDGCRFQEVQFTECKIVGTEFFKCEKQFFSVTFKNCSLQYCNFSDLDMSKTAFTGSKLRENYFTNTLLKSACFDDVDLSGTLFHNCDFTQADFSRANHYSIDPQANKIKKAKFSFPEVVGLLNGFEITIVKDEG
ncbi:MAG: pentapeptide repeat-containing protein, partial [Parachlamydiaceae bacterium]